MKVSLPAFPTVAACRQAANPHPVAACRQAADATAPKPGGFGYRRDQSLGGFGYRRDQSLGGFGYRRDRRGAMLILLVIMLFAFLMTVAMSIDIAYMHLTRSELRASTDAAAKAAATVLADTLDTDAAIAAGQRMAVRNPVGGQPLSLARGDFSFGASVRGRDGRFVFDPAAATTNSVRVDGRRSDGSLSGPVPLFFGNLTGTQVFTPELTATATFLQRDITLVIDRSGSMAGTKFVDLTAAIGIFVDLLAETPVREVVGLASYSEDATEDVQLTTDFNEITTAMTRLPVGGRTSISRGMSAGRQIARRGRDTNFVERTMIVMTDGRHNTGPEPRSVARQLARENTTIHTITFGVGADRPRMIEIADIGDGRHFHADNGAQLRAVYREIALTLGTLVTQ